LLKFSTKSHHQGITEKHNNRKLCVSVLLCFTVSVNDAPIVESFYTKPETDGMATKFAILQTLFDVDFARSIRFYVFRDCDG